LLINEAIFLFLKIKLKSTVFKYDFKRLFSKFVDLIIFRTLVVTKLCHQGVVLNVSYLILNSSLSPPIPAPDN
jgi:hypothetical protein